MFVTTEQELEVTKPLGRVRMAELRARAGMVELPPGTKAKGVIVGIRLCSTKYVICTEAEEELFRMLTTDLNNLTFR